MLHVALANCVARAVLLSRILTPRIAQPLAVYLVSGSSRAVGGVIVESRRELGSQVRRWGPKAQEFTVHRGNVNKSQFQSLLVSCKSVVSERLISQEISV